MRETVDSARCHQVCSICTSFPEQEVDGRPRLREVPGAVVLEGGEHFFGFKGLTLGELAASWAHLMSGCCGLRTKSRYRPDKVVIGSQGSCFGFIVLSDYESLRGVGVSVRRSMSMRMTGRNCPRCCGNRGLGVWFI
jgi:hypothetical protein